MTNKIINESIINSNSNSNNNIPKKLMINNIFEIKNNNNSNKNSDLPLIKVKNQSNNCNINKHNLFIKSLLFNPITYDTDKMQRKSLLSPIPNQLNKNKNYSSAELVPLSKKKLQPLNLNRCSSEIKINNYSSSSSKDIRQNQKQISTNIFSDSSKDSNKENNSINKGIKYKNLNLKIIDFLTKYKFRGHKDITVRNKYKYICNNKHIQEFKKSILDLYNKIDETKRKYLDHANFVHRFLFNTDRTISPHYDSSSAPNKNKKMSEILSYGDNTNEINPKYEYIDYFGRENKVITRLTSTLNKINTDNINNNEKNNLILHKQLRAPKLIALKDSEDYKNKNYIKVLQKKKNEQRKNNEKIKKNKGNDNVIDISKKGFEKLKNNRIKNFSGMIKYTVKQHKSVINKLDNIIEVDKEQYEKFFNEVDPNSNDIIF